MSKLLKEDDEYLYLYEYLHSSPDEIPQWAYGTEDKYSDEIIEADHYALYEVRIDYRIRKADASVIIDSIE